MPLGYHLSCFVVALLIRLRNIHGALVSDISEK
jgi:hypothetical protein